MTDKAYQELRKEMLGNAEELRKMWKSEIQWKTQALSQLESEIRNFSKSDVEKILGRLEYFVKHEYQAFNREDADSESDSYLIDNNYVVFTENTTLYADDFNRYIGVTDKGKDLYRKMKQKPREVNEKTNKTWEGEGI